MQDLPGQAPCTAAVLGISQHLHAKSKPDCHRLVTEYAIRSLTTAGLPTSTKVTLSQPMANMSVDAAAIDDAVSSHMPPLPPGQATDAPGNTVVTAKLCLFRAAGDVDVQAAHKAAALCQPALLVEALQAAQAAQWGLQDFNTALAPDEAGLPSGEELLLGICVLAACSCWCKSREPSLSAATNDEVNAPSEVTVVLFVFACCHFSSCWLCCLQLCKLCATELVSLTARRLSMGCC